LERYRHGGYDALREGRRSGRKRKVDAELLRWLYEAIIQHDPRPFCLWTLGIVRTLLQRKFGVELSKSARITASSRSWAVAGWAWSTRPRTPCSVALWH
jgi:transposase